MPSRQLRRDAEVSALPEVQAFIEQESERAGLDPAAAGRLALATEEIFVNICRYAYPDAGPGWVELVAWTEDGDFHLEISDAGIPFDGPARAEPDLSAPLEDRQIGGLGWMLVRKMVDALSYRRDAGRNQVRLTMHLPEDPDAQRDRV
ncbi:ATP-binding protein [Thiorhodococcus minor]|uniref:ATP-binding protein n=1 Tax=Thiorhodococcus minor TaxID=57489 RepID=A0A6M0JZY4_9GAMM|nr:ATP-binding protein [Thiorhodococcus minor]